MNPSTLAAHSRLSRNPDMVAGKIDADVMVMSIETGTYCQLNAIGGEILEILQEPMSLEALAGILQERFKLTPELVESDLLPFLQQLASRQIIIIE